MWANQSYHSEFLLSSGAGIVVDLDYAGIGCNEFVVEVFCSDTGSLINEFYTYNKNKAVKAYNDYFSKYAAIGKIVYSDGKFFNW